MSPKVKDTETMTKQKNLHSPVARHCGFASGTHVTAMIYIGWPTKDLPAIERPAPAITYFN